MGEPTTIPAPPLAAPLIIDIPPAEPAATQRTFDMPEPQSNGHGPTPADEDAKMVASLRKRVEALAAQRDELQAQMDEITPHLRRYEKAILALEGQPINQHRQRSDDGEPPSLTGPKRGRPAGIRPKGKSGSISDERLVPIEQAVRDLAREQDDISQVAVRTRTGDNSGTMAIAFEVLRQRNVIRLVRQEGNVKVFRLTREALNAQPDAD